LQELGQGKAFKQNEEGHTFMEFAQIAQKTEGDTRNIDFKAIEREYWD
jgi:hypothetical protein